MAVGMGAKKVAATAASKASSISRSNSISRKNSFSDRSSGGASSGSIGNQSQLIKVLKQTGIHKSKKRGGGGRNHKKNIPLVKLDNDHPDLKAFYWKISTKTKVDQDKLMHELKKVFKEQADVIWPMIRKIFGHFNHPITFHDYCFHITKYLSSEIDPCKEAFFSFADLNKDKLICETDLFRVIKSLKSDETS
tara:strand:+ start:72 stop:650 length:579 start_codon:yes stop_codon:yes gene_type:complete